MLRLVQRQRRWCQGQAGARARGESRHMCVPVTVFLSVFCTQPLMPSRFASAHVYFRIHTRCMVLGEPSKGWARACDRQTPLMAYLHSSKHLILEKMKAGAPHCATPRRHALGNALQVEAVSRHD